MRIPKLPPLLDDLLNHEVQESPDLLKRASNSPILETIELANDEAWNWEDCSHRAHRAKLTARQLWALIKLSRQSGRQPSPIIDTHGRKFTYRLPAAAHRTLHFVDKYLGGTISSTFPEIATLQDQDRYLLTALRDEAISSSLIEGAVSTREQANELIRTERKPRNRSEQMIMNNYQTIQFLNRRRDEELTPELLKDVQQRLTHNTLKDEDEAGRFRLPHEQIVVFDDESHQILHDPPPAQELEERIAALCQFANAQDTIGHGFIHPAVRAILLYFWLAYDHPFVDGNGRAARALFYWCMLKNGYWLVEYLTISTIISGHTKQYARAYLNTEREGNDLTYFVMYHLRVIDRSIQYFRDYLAKTVREQNQLLQAHVGRFNARQRSLLVRALQDPLAIFTFQSHAGSHGIALQTARGDLQELVALQLLRENRKGRQFEFTPAPNISDVLKKLAS